MTRTVLITGASGALGPHVLAELLRSRDVDRIFVLLRPGERGLDERARVLSAAVSQVMLEENCGPECNTDRLTFVGGDIRRAGLGLNPPDRLVVARDTHTIVHAGASTSFRAPIERLREVNVAGTSHALRFAAGCRSLQQFLLVSTVCVAGTRTGSVAERLEEHRPGFVNAYEETKWEAERLTIGVDLPIRIGRLSTCLGGARTGYVHRFGALHHALHWMKRGLIPMIPGAHDSRIDVIANDVAARWIARAVATPVGGLEVCHVAAGAAAPALGELVAAAVAAFAVRGDRSSRAIDPVFVDSQTFDLFRRSVEQSGDLLFARVLASTRPFLPVLAFPKTYETQRAEQCWGGPLAHPPWRSVLNKVIEFGCAHGWAGVPNGMEAADV